MADTSIDPATISWELNDTKRAADQMVFRAMSFDLNHQSEVRKGRPIRVLSFPGERWTWEQSLDEAFRMKFSFKGLERDTQVHVRSTLQEALLPGRYNLFPEPTPFEDYMGSASGKRSRFDLVYLDWMGTWSKEKKQDLDALLGGGCSLEVGGLLLFTISLRRGRPETLEELEDQSYDLPLTFYDARGRDRYVSNLKVRGVPNWVARRAEDSFGVTLRPIMANIYYSEAGRGQTQPQLQLMFLREQ